MSEFKSSSRYFNSSNKINFEDTGEIIKDIKKQEEKKLKERENILRLEENLNIKLEENKSFSNIEEFEKISKLKDDINNSKLEKNAKKSILKENLNVFKLKNLDFINNKEKMILTSAFDKFNESIEFKENNLKHNNSLKKHSKCRSFSPVRKNDKLFQNEQLMSINKENIIKKKKNKLKKKYVKKLPNSIGMKNLTNQSDSHFLSMKKCSKKNFKKNLNNRSFKQIKGVFNFQPKLSLGKKKKKKINNNHSKTYLMNRKTESNIFYKNDFVGKIDFFRKIHLKKFSFKNKKSKNLSVNSSPIGNKDGNLFFYECQKNFKKKKLKF